MIQIKDTNGALGLGLCRSYVEALLRGERVCIPAAMGAPHVCLFFAEDDPALLARLKELWPDGFVPGAHVEDRRAKEQV
jgi:hypothetical protein